MHRHHPRDARIKQACSDFLLREEVGVFFCDNTVKNSRQGAKSSSFACKRYVFCGMIKNPVVYRFFALPENGKEIGEVRMCLNQK